MSRLRGAWQVIKAYTVTLIIGLPALLLVVLSFGKLGPVIGRPVLRIFSRGVLRVLGVRVEREGWERLAGREARIVTFNHLSLLDAFIVNAWLPEGGVPVSKRELVNYPVAGWLARSFPIVLLDRGNSDEARAALRATGERIRKEKLSVVIAPEGTRKHGGRPGPFKMGPFHLALASGAPIYPMAIMDSHLLMPYGQGWTRKGTVHVRILEPVPTDDYSEDNLREKAEELREVYRGAFEAFDQERAP